MIDVAEMQLGHVLALVGQMREGRFREIEPTPEALAAFRGGASCRRGTDVWMTGCSSWYLGKDGIPAGWTMSYDRFREAMEHPPDSPTTSGDEHGGLRPMMTTPCGMGRPDRWARPAVGDHCRRKTTHDPDRRARRRPAADLHRAADVLNAFDADQFELMAERMLEAQEDAATTVVVVTGAGRAFSAGFDLTSTDRPRGRTYRYGFAGLVDSRHRLPQAVRVRR